MTLFSVMACQDDILDKEPLDIISEAVVWSDQSLVDAYLAHQYYNTPVMVNDAPSAKNISSPYDGMEWTEMFIGSCAMSTISDEAKTAWWYWGDIRGYKSFGITINGGFSEYMELPYKTIRNLNEIITNLSGKDEDWTKLRVAEARFLRAFNYFAMVKRYGGVPLITKVQQMNDPEEELFPKRNSEKEIYDFIIQEMDEIAPVLKNTVDIGRPNDYAAMALKCRAALYAGSIAQFGKVQLDGLLGFPASDASSYYQKSYDAASYIISSGKYALYDADEDKVTNFKNVFIKKNTSEAILVRQHDNTDGFNNGNSWGWNFVMAPKPHAWNCGWTTAPYLEMAEAFEKIDGSSGKLDRDAVQQGLWSMEELWKDKDPRFFASIWTNETPWMDGKVDLHNGLIDAEGNLLENQSQSYENVPAWGNQVVEGLFHTSFGVLKYCDDVTAKAMSGYMANSSNDYLIFRYAEILLNYAEAAFELGKQEEALESINKIRNRAGIALLSTIDREKIRHERKVELAFEAHRYWDVRRWRTATEELSKSNSGIRYIGDYNTRKFKIVILNDVDGTNNKPNFREVNYYFPITLARTGVNKNLVENPGYN